MEKFDIQENLKRLPDCPGVYLHKDKLGQVIYVGKAISLKNRVRQYFQSYGRQNPKVRAMVSHIAEFEYITCKSEMEALILECNLIKKYMPKYNVLLRDDKTYPYIAVTISEEFPRVIKTRQLKKDGNRYFGPYSDVGAVNSIVDMLNEIYMLKTCTMTSFPNGFRPCLRYHIKQCRGNCIGQVSRDEYKKDIEEIIDFLSGRHRPLKEKLTNLMLKASEELKFEEAASYRDYLKSMEAISEVQRVTMVKQQDMDLLIPIILDDSAYVVLFPVREGKLSGRELFPMNVQAGESKEEILRQFIPQYYSQWAELPGEILVSCQVDDKSLLEEYLRRQERKCLINHPKKGAKKALLDLAINDSIELLKTLKLKSRLKQDKETSIGEEVSKIISMAREKSGKIHQQVYESEDSMTYENPNFTIKDGGYRIEAYDISNTNGVDSVGAMVVFRGLTKVRKDYRRFKIKTVEGPNDYGSLQEVLTRRLRRAVDGSKGFDVLPDLILMDGGLGQVTSVTKVIRDLGLDIAVVGLAKDDSHRTRAVVFEDSSELELKSNSLIFSYFGTIQEEVHRFAIEYHRKLRNNTMLKSALESIRGIGPAKRKKLLDEFKSLENIKNATKEELIKVEGITEGLAENILTYFREKK